MGRSRPSPAHPHSTRGGIEGKECAHCHKWKPLIHYSSNKRTKDGLAYSCRTCTTSLPGHTRDKNEQKLRSAKKAYPSALHPEYVFVPPRDKINTRVVIDVDALNSLSE